MVLAKAIRQAVQPLVERIDRLERRMGEPTVN